MQNFKLNLTLGDSANVFSLFNGKLLIGRGCFNYLMIYDHNGNFLSTLSIYPTTLGEELIDATWTPQGFILYATSMHKIVRMTDTGTEVKNSHFSEPNRFTISDDNIIYLSCGYRGVFQSIDDGVHWIHIVTKAKDWACMYAIKIACDNDYELWIKVHQYQTARLRAYKFINGSVLNEGVWKEIDVNISDTEINGTVTHYSIAYDGNKNIIIGAIDQKTIYVFSVTGYFQFQLLSSNQIEHVPNKVVVDRKRLRMYVLQDKNTVGVFQLFYN